MGEVTFDHRHLAMLALERQHFKYPARKEGLIRETFDISPTRYYQALDTVLAMPEALAVDPELVNRLLRLREARRAARSGERAAV